MIFIRNTTRVHESKFGTPNPVKTAITNAKIGKKGQFAQFFLSLSKCDFPNFLCYIAQAEF